MSLEIQRTLVLSTAHLTETTAKHLTETNSYGLIVFPKGDYGWFINVDGGGDVPDDLAACIKLADANKCEWVCLDNDGPKVAELPTYEW